MDLYILLTSTGYACFGGALIGYWHDIKGKKLPEFEVTLRPDQDVEPVQTKSNRRERLWFVFACTLLSGVIGLMIGLYYLGFMDIEELPNGYARAFISILAGFLTPKVLEYSDSLSISKLIDRFRDK